MEKVKEWLSPLPSPAERRPLIGAGNGTNEYFTEQSETEIDDDAYASSSDFPAGYAAHYATFPSINDQKLIQERKKLVMTIIIGTFVGSTVLTAISGILVATGRHRLRVEVDAGVFTGVAASLFFATMAFAGMLYEHERIGTAHRWAFILAFIVICVLNSFILTMVMIDTRL